MFRVSIGSLGHGKEARSSIACHSLLSHGLLFRPNSFSIRRKGAICTQLPCIGSTS